jgi:hypothetical protein
LKSKYDPTLYFRFKRGKLVGALTTHVDDLAIFGKPLFVDLLIASLKTKFKVGADKELHHFCPSKSPAISQSNSCT